MKIGFIGAGNMGGTILKGLLSKLPENEYFVCGRDYEKTKEFAKNLRVKVIDDIEALVSKSDWIFIGVKPNKFPEVMPHINNSYSKDKVYVSMAAGVSIAEIEKYLDKSAKVIRIMPNTPALVGEAMISVSANELVKEDELRYAVSMLNKLGSAVPVSEDLIHSVIGVSGSSPAYTYMYIEGLVKNGISNGMDEDSARTFAAQAVLGAAKMVLETKLPLRQLISNVCSPGGTTIEAVNFLEAAGFEDIVNAGAQAAVDKSKRMNG